MNPRMLTVARESRGLSRTDLAEKSGIPVPTLSKAESGQAELPEERQQTIARVLCYPRHILDWPDPIYAPQSSAFYHRKQQTLPKKILNRAHAVVNLELMRMRRLSEGLGIQPPFSLPTISSDDEGQTPEEIANRVRHIWALPPGPVGNMVGQLEAAGCLINRIDFESSRISAISLRISGHSPLFVLNQGMPGDRDRYSLAHELGHVVMHEFLPLDGEEEADRFAAEFLMPASGIRPHLRDIDLRKAAQLKTYWKTSMASLIRRARDLDVISPSRYKSLMVQMSQRQIRKVEPVELPVETPTLIDTMVRVHREDHGYTESDLADAIGLYQDEFRAAYGAATHGILRIIR